MDRVIDAKMLNPVANSAPLPAPLAPSRLEQEQASFAQVMNIANRTIDSQTAERAQPAPSDTTRKAAQDFVALAFVQPILKQLRESNQAAAPFAATSAQKSFQGMLDGVLSRKITQGSHWALVDKVEDRMLRRAGGTAGGTTGGTGVSPVPLVALR